MTQTNKLDIMATFKKVVDQTIHTFIVKAVKDMDLSPEQHEQMQALYKKMEEPPPKKSGPKRTNGWMLFCSEHRSGIKQDQPTLNPTEITKELGRMWRDEIDRTNQRRI